MYNPRHAEKIYTWYFTQESRQIFSLVSPIWATEQRKISLQLVNTGGSGTLITLDGLKPLYKSMQAQNIDRYRFAHQHGRIIFDVFFFIDEIPFLLLFGAREYNFSFEFKVERGFRVKPYIDKPEFKTLCNALELTYDPNNPFSPEAFLEDFNSRVSNSANLSGRVKPEEIVIYRRSVEEADKIYFCGWRNNNLRGEHVTTKNLEKTHMLLGANAYKICKLKNISSCWTDERIRASAFRLPDDS